MLALFGLSLQAKLANAHVRYEHALYRERDCMVVLKMRISLTLHQTTHDPLTQG